MNKDIGLSALADVFNNGDSVPIVNGGYKVEKLLVDDISFKQGLELKDSYFSKSYPEKWFLVFKLKLGEVVIEQVQMLFANDDGSLSNPMIPSYVGKDGQKKPATLSYDIWEAIAAYMEKAGEVEELEKLRLETKGLSKERFLGRYFEIGIKMGNRKEGNGLYVILETSYQKFKDQEYKTKSNGGDDLDNLFVAEDFVDNTLLVEELINDTSTK